ncbi:MAG: 3-dehydro-L-gulonate 2-dehydrogenase [Sediminibacterium sp.]|nr:3-dehydro-L-gulonate 2-dehydrogenase [Sediminibacterium sp.]
MSANTGTIHIMPEEMQGRFAEILRKLAFSEEDARQCAAIFTGNSIDGIYTHGVNRFPRFVKYITDGYVKAGAVPSLTHAFGAIEQWDGNLGPGPLNALHATDSAMRLATEHGIGCVAMANTNHWMRGGTYGWRAAKAGFVFIGWTNTISNMPAWGAVDARLGNNPLVLSLPYRQEAIVLDMAMSQYSLGAMELAAIRNEKLPVAAGFDKNGQLTDDPVAILASRRLIPSGYWKGAGLALLLDILATILSGGKATHQVTKEAAEYGISQVFIAIDPSRLANHSSVAAAVENIITDYHLSALQDSARPVIYPGERVMQTRERNTQQGIPVLKKIWDMILAISDGTADISVIPYL